MCAHNVTSNKPVFTIHKIINLHPKTHMRKKISTLIHDFSSPRSFPYRKKSDTKPKDSDNNSKADRTHVRRGSRQKQLMISFTRAVIPQNSLQSHAENLLSQSESFFFLSWDRISHDVSGGLFTDRRYQRFAASTAQDRQWKSRWLIRSRN